MFRGLRDNWRDAAFWLWWWRENVSGVAKAALGLCLAVGVGVAGFLSAGALSNAASTPAADRATIVTVWDEAAPRTVVRTHLVRRVSTVRQPVTVTEWRTAPAHTVVRYVPGPVRTSVVEQTVPRRAAPVVHAVQAPTQTVTTTTTLPAETVTSVVTEVETVTVTAVSPPVTVTVDRPPKGPRN